MKSIDPKIMPYPQNLLMAIEQVRSFQTVECPEPDEDQMLGLQHALNMLGEREREVLLYRYKECESYCRIGEHYGRSVERIRQIHMKALRKLAHPSRMEYYRDGYKRTEERKQAEELRRREEFEAIWGRHLRDWENIAVEDIGFSVRTYNCLRRAGMETLADLMRAMLDDPGAVRGIRNMGMRSFREIELKLVEYTGGLWKLPYE